MPRFNRLLITGAAGNLGRELRAGLAPLAHTLRLTDRAEMAPAGANEEVVQADVGDFDAMMNVVEGCDALFAFSLVSGVPIKDALLWGWASYSAYAMVVLESRPTNNR